MTPGVVIVVLNWNGLADTLACLGSLSRLDYPSYEVVVVDNGSTDESAEAIQAHFPGVTVIENGENLGFTGGNNVGLCHALEWGTDYVLLLNNDTEVAPDFLRHMVEATEADPAAGIAGPTIYYYSQPEMIWSAGGAIDWRRGQTWMVGVNEQDDGQFGLAPREVDFVSGCTMLVRQAVLEEVGLLDPRFFAYYEEAEWCTRAMRAGWGIIHVPQARVWHKISIEQRAESPMRHYYMTRNRLLFLRATGAGLSAWFHTLVLEYLRTLISWSVRPRWRGKRTQRQAMFKALCDFQRGRFGQVRL